ncbi:folylpolyglutamate synthase/dihydrofolate synthase family protein [Thermosulfurimonas sp. F29]|uniref:bifunctional folylpolyglutamate synthase/dihydrofolate synthase n=1 Tax=Thermosulfurimonas sp. F29 TaxID=2867247 RepID=UPI001C8317B2|nr:folylpolyglutamate synthase/dihydrofolate synthase family protein [Thermosulfurimonas sp. F29]MBX6422343.1 bifunctional folylpolyglutamate synthase/dihydrofolate synthase [Thermosulfurimonas sp. F29]
MNFEEALTWLEQHQFHGIKPGLARISRLLEALGHPEKCYPCVHLAGTNGKGSTAAILSAILSAHGLRTGLYTSPHLVSVTERFRIDGREIPPERLAEVLTRVRRKVEALDLPVTYFEITTAAAFLYFAEEKVDFAVIECGMGGRLDATNVCRPLVSVITSVARDHTAYLGNNLWQIAFEKAGIIKSGVPAVIGKVPPEARKVILAKAINVKSPTYLWGHDFRVRKTGKRLLYRGLRRTLRNLTLSLRGTFQKYNLGMALAVMELLEENGFPFREDLIRRGLEGVVWPGRFEYFPLGSGIILDGAHNEEGVEALLSSLKQMDIHKYCLVFGATNEGGEKPYLYMLQKLARGAEKILICEPPGPRHPVSLADWKRHISQKDYPGIDFCQTPEEALKKALKEGSPVVVTGSLYLVGAIRKILKGGEESLPSPKVIRIRIPLHRVRKCLDR